MVGRVESTRIVMEEPSMTQQADAAEADINSIVARAKRGADISHLANVREPIYADFTNYPTFIEAMRVVALGKSAFEQLDAFIRERFGNDPAKLILFLDDPKNRDEAIRLGLVAKPAVVPDTAPVVPGVDPLVARVEALEADTRADRGDSIVDRAAPAARKRST